MSKELIPQRPQVSGDVIYLTGAAVKKCVLTEKQRTLATATSSPQPSAHLSRTHPAGVGRDVSLNRKIFSPSQKTLP